MTSLLQLKSVEAHFKVGIRVYQPAANGAWHLLRQPAHYDQVGIPTMVIGLYEQHSIYIKNMTKLAHTYVCGGCTQQFTTASNLHIHTSCCSKGETKIVCSGTRVLPPQSAYENAFYPTTDSSEASTRWLEWEAKDRGTHIHHALCGYGDERWIAGAPVDGYDPQTKTVCQYHGCHWHGCQSCFPSAQQRLAQVRVDKKGTPVRDPRDGFPENPRAGEEDPQRDHETPRPWNQDPLPLPTTQTYPHAIVYDFEFYLDKSQASNPTKGLSFENIHTPISVSLGDTLDPQPEHLCNRDPKALIEAYMEALERRSAPFEKMRCAASSPQTCTSSPRSNSACSKSSVIKSRCWVSTPGAEV
ncbi:hypothetical protein QZH41_006045 [Actinostola sp. cb2023]|nr:hypothetical protein QZH41_006045 [Actinostola sp. cb2023]